MSLESAKESLKKVPIWIIAVAGLVAALVIIFCIYCCCCRKCGKKDKKDKDKKNGKERVDLQAVKIGASYQEKVQPSMDELDYNSEDYHSDVSSGVKIGRINFTLDYSFNDNTLTIGIIKAEDIPAKDFSGSSDPYVKIYLLPDKKKKMETKVHRRTLNPVFNETFVFKNIPYSEITNRILLMELYDFDRFSRHDLIGEARLPLIDVDLASSINEWRVLTPPHSSRSAAGGSRSELGEICFSLRYVPTAGKLQITIVEAKSLKSMDLSGYSDPYVKIALVQEGRKIKKKKTTVKKRTLDPYFNETFTFQVPFEKIEQSSLIISVLDYDRVGRSEMIGKCVVGELSSGADLRHWVDMLGSPRRAVTQWHTLHN
ncbi:synaptotagmin-1-like isoform X2 [Actinia tenebrosa]|uniref:Synaptotagmin-1-like isoform X2 n=1 Tax=Actinia tenebrosa TaxID=6105 RepID=A0A6P8IS46_ACTTE|nr:synaptotagmin-1-like isoform X2 [Actinia tenebrosa]